MIKSFELQAMAPMLLCAGLWAALAACQGASGVSHPHGTSSGTSNGCPGNNCGYEAGGAGPIDNPPPTDTTPVTLAPTPPPALGGGTLMVAGDGKTAIAADSDRDTVSWVDFTAAQPAVRTVDLQMGDEPGRLVQDAAGLVHVVLRRAGVLATIDLGAAKVVRRSTVCPAPRGVAYDTAADAVVVACVGGELVTLAAADDTVQRTLQLETDLRDVAVLGNGFLAVSKLRTAEVLLLDAAGTLRARTQPAADGKTDPVVAWRMVKIPGATGVAVAHQRAQQAPINVGTPGGYTGFEGQGTDIVTSQVSLIRYDFTEPAPAATITSIPVQGALPVDVAVDQGGARVLVALYGSGLVAEYDAATAAPLGSPWQIGATGAAYYGTGQFVAFSREPASFTTYPGATVTVPGAASVRDTGFDLFHDAARQGGSLACASCHPEGRDDGRVWQFSGVGPRRTKSLVGGVMETMPFHWAGDLMNLDALMAEVFTNRMGGLFEDSAHVAAVGRFLDAIPRVPIAPPSPSASLDNGKALFESATLGCTGCHSGAHLTTNAVVDVGTGQPFKVPTLIGVGLRAPYLHDGCAATLPDRFGACGGGDQHGQTSQLSPSDVADLSLYVGSL